jgi:hypothetical protein
MQTQLGERVMVSVVPVLSALHALKQPRITLPMLELISHCCNSGMSPFAFFLLCLLRATTTLTDLRCRILLGWSPARRPAV